MPDKIKSPYMRIKNYTLYLGGQDFSISALNKPKQLYYATLHHTSPHITSPRLTSLHIASPHLTSLHLASPHLDICIHDTTYEASKKPARKHGKHPQ